MSDKRSGNISGSEQEEEQKTSQTQASIDNRANQLNPNNPVYYSSRSQTNKKRGTHGSNHQKHR